jgi:hypothetical protein
MLTHSLTHMHTHTGPEPPRLVPRVIQSMTRTLHGGDSFFLLSHIFAGFGRSQTNQMMSRVLVTSHKDNPLTEVRFDRFGQAEGGAVAGALVLVT